MEYFTSATAEIDRWRAGVGSASLTPREMDVVKSIGAGRSNREIAAELSLTESTVKSHVTRVLNKLALPDRVHVAIWAWRSGLVGGDQ